MVNLECCRMKYAGIVHIIVSSFFSVSMEMNQLLLYWASKIFSQVFSTPHLLPWALQEHKQIIINRTYILYNGLSLISGQFRQQWILYHWIYVLLPALSCIFIFAIYQCIANRRHVNITISGIISLYSSINSCLIIFDMCYMLVTW